MEESTITDLNWVLWGEHEHLLCDNAHRVQCVLIFNWSHLVSQLRTKSMWECTCFSFSYNLQSQHKLCQAVLFSLCWHKHTFTFTSSYLFHVCHIYTAGSHWTLSVPATSAAALLPFPSCPPAFSPWGSLTGILSGLQKHSLCLLPKLDSPFILDNATASDEGSRECQSGSWCLYLHKHKIYWWNIKQMVGKVMRHSNES